MKSEMDGWEFLDHFANKFWQFFTDTKVIITSYSIDKRDYERVKEYPFVIDFLSSPISTEYLRNLQGSLAQSSMLQN